MTSKHKKIPISKYGFPQKVKIVPAKKGRPKEKSPNDIVKKDVFNEFVEWAALPSPLREPEYQKDFAEKWGVQSITLSRWKKRQDFWEAVAATRLMWAKDKTPDVIHALYKNAAKTGSAAEVKLWLQAIEDWSEKAPAQAPSITVIGIQGITQDDLKRLTQKEGTEPERNILEAEEITET